MSSVPTNERRIQMQWTQMTPADMERICRSILDRESDVPLRRVDLMENHLGPANAQKLTACLESSPVREVLLRYNDIGKDGCDGLAGVVNVSLQVEEVDVRGNNLNSNDARKLLRSLATSSSVKRLVLANNKLGPSGASLLYKFLEKNSYLTSLDVSMNELGPTGADSLAQLLALSCSTIRSINLYGNYLGPAGVRRICQAVKANKEVRQLNLGNNNATDAAASAIAEMMEANYTLEVLDLRLNTITTEGMREIAKQGVEKNASITTLVLSGNPLGNVGGDLLSKAFTFNQRSSVSELDLSSCSLGSSGGMRMASVMGSSIALRTVNLSDNQLDDDTAVSLARNISNSISLRHVDLSCNAIGESGAADLIEAALMNPHLCSLVLRGNDVSRVMEKKLDNLLEERLAHQRVDREGLFGHLKSEEAATATAAVTA